MTGVIGLPVVVAIIYFGGLPLQYSLLAVSIVGMTEFYDALSDRHLSVHFLGYVFAAIYYYMLDKLNANFILIFSSLFIVSIFSYVVVFYKKDGFRHCLVTFFGFFFVAFMLSFIYLIRVKDMGNYFVWLVLVCSFGTDTFALFAGKAFGRHKLAPEISPNKTIEGSIGGVIGAGVIAFIYGLCVMKFMNVNNVNVAVYFTIVCIFGSVFAQLGDLSASAIKRYTKIKDFGKILPGHGGIIDRFDSMFFTAPVVYAVMSILLSRG